MVKQLLDTPKMQNRLDVAVETLKKGDYIKLGDISGCDYVAASVGVPRVIDHMLNRFCDMRIIASKSVFRSHPPTLKPAIYTFR